MKKIVGIRFKKQGKIYFFNPNNIKLEKGESAIVETARGLELGEVAVANKNISEDKLVAALKKVVRIATPDDEKIYFEYPVLSAGCGDGFHGNLCHLPISCAGKA